MFDRPLNSHLILVLIEKLSDLIMCLNLINTDDEEDEEEEE
jgi:hypothetical protein